MLEDRSNALGRHGVGISTGYLFEGTKQEIRSVERAEMSSKGRSERRRAGGGTPSPINSESPPPARVWGSSSACLQIEKRQLPARWRPTAAQLHFGSGGPGRTLGRGTRGEVQRVGEKWWSPRFRGTLVGALLGDTATLAPLAAVVWCSALGEGIGVRLWRFAGAEAEGKTRLGFWCGGGVMVWNICRRGYTNIRN